MFFGMGVGRILWPLRKGEDFDAVFLFAVFALYGDMKMGILVPLLQLSIYAEIYKKIIFNQEKVAEIGTYSAILTKKWPIRAEKAIFKKLKKSPAKHRTAIYVQNFANDVVCQWRRKKEDRTCNFFSGGDNSARNALRNLLSFAASPHYA